MLRISDAICIFRNYKAYIQILKSIFVSLVIVINPFVPNTLFLYPLKTSETVKVFKGKERVY